MAVHRETPKCHYCGAATFKMILNERASHEAPVFGDNFSHWEPIPHTCEGLKEAMNKSPIVDKIDLNNLGTPNT